MKLLHFFLVAALLPSGALAADTKTVEPVGAGFSGHGPEALTAATQDIMNVFPEGKPVGLSVLVELRRLAGSTEGTPEHRAALTLVLGAVSQEPLAIERLAASGLPRATLSRLADAGLLAAEAAKTDEGVAKRLELIRGEVAAAVARAGGETPSLENRIASLEDLARFAKDLPPQPQALAVPEDLDAPLGPAPTFTKGTSGSLRYTKWRSRVMAKVSEPLAASTLLAEAAGELPPADLAALVRDFSKTVVVPGASAFPSAKGDVDRQRNGILAVARLYSDSGWGRRRFERELFAEFFKGVASRNQKVTSAAEWGYMKSEGRSYASFTALEAQTDMQRALADAVAKRPALAAAPQVADGLLEGLNALKQSTDQLPQVPEAARKDANIIEGIRMTARAAEALLKALDEAAKTQGDLLTIERLARLESFLAAAAASPSFPDDAKASALALLETLERRAPPAPPPPPPPAPQTALAVAAPEVSPAVPAEEEFAFSILEKRLGTGQVVSGVAAFLAALLAGAGLVGFLPALLVLLAAGGGFTAATTRKRSERRRMERKRERALKASSPEAVAALEELDRGGFGMDLEEKLALLETRTAGLLPPAADAPEKKTR